MRKEGYYFVKSIYDSFWSIAYWDQTNKFWCEGSIDYQDTAFKEIGQRIIMPDEILPDLNNYGIIKEILNSKNNE